VTPHKIFKEILVPEQTECVGIVFMGCQQLHPACAPWDKMLSDGVRGFAI